MIVVIGLGRETRGLLHVFDRQRPGIEVAVIDEGPAPEPALFSDLETITPTVTGNIDLDRPDALKHATEIFRSPGVSPYRPALAAAVARGVPMTTPTGWWATNRDGAGTIALTGTKGKSTTSALVAHLLEAAGRNVALVGNIGVAAMEAPADAQDTVLELSSYQLADMEASFALAGVTTLLQDHVPWHGSLEVYHRDKLRLVAMAKTTIVTRQVAAATATDIAAVTTTLFRGRIAAALATAGLVGDHLVDDAELALALVDARLGQPASVDALIETLATFAPLPHRLTPVAQIDGVTYVDDSISTVPESAVAAVSAWRAHGPVTVLLGGDDRDQNLDPLVQLLADEDVRAVLLPPLGSRLAAALRPVATERVSVATDLADAVNKAAAITPVGGAVVLSPAAPSFSAYRDFAARGEHFVELVQKGT